MLRVPILHCFEDVINTNELVNIRFYMSNQRGVIHPMIILIKFCPFPRIQKIPFRRRFLGSNIFFHAVKLILALVVRIKSWPFLWYFALISLSQMLFGCLRSFHPHSGKKAVSILCLPNVQALFIFRSTYFIPSYC